MEMLILIKKSVLDNVILTYLSIHCDMKINFVVISVLSLLGSISEMVNIFYCFINCVSWLLNQLCTLPQVELVFEHNWSIFPLIHSQSWQVSLELFPILDCWSNSSDNVILTYLSIHCDMKINFVVISVLSLLGSISEMVNI
jgi:hypothetical protein